MQPQNPTELLISEILCKAESSDLARNIKSYCGSGCVFNTESAWHYINDSSFREFVHKCSYIFIDGSALVLALWFFKIRLHRNHGPNVLNTAIKYGEFDSVLVVGGSKESANILLNDSAAYGIDDILPLPFFQSKDDFFSVEESLRKFVERRPGRKLILVSLGLPKQEMFTNFILERNIVVPSRDLVLPVGAAIDFLAGTKARGGRMWQYLGLEWLPRLIREPRMLPRVYRSLEAVIRIIRYRKSFLRLDKS